MADDTYEKLKKARASTTISLRPTPMLRTEIVGLDGKTVPFKLRYYQVQGIYHLVVMNRMILGDATGIGKCVTAETRLMTREGYQCIGDLRPKGDLTPETFHEPTQPCEVWTGERWASVRRFYWDGVRPTLRVRTHHGFSIEGSHSHPVLVRTKQGAEVFRTLPELQPGDFLCIDRKAQGFSNIEPQLTTEVASVASAKRYTLPCRMDPDLARLMGYIVAEAWIGDRYHIHVTQYVDTNPDSHTDIRRLFRSVFGWEGNDNAKSKDSLIGVSSVQIREFLRLHGVDFSTSRTKTVPWVIFKSTRESVKGFLQGVFEGEGSVDPHCGNIELSSSSNRLIHDIQLLLLGFGLVARVSPKHIQGCDHTYWRLTLCGDQARLFQQSIGFVSERKRQLLAGSLSEASNPNKDVVPHAVELVRGLKGRLLEMVSMQGANGLRKGSGLKQFGRSFESTLSHVCLGHRNPTYRFLRQLLEVSSVYGLVTTAEFKCVEEVVRHGYFYDPVKTVTTGSAEVMDIEVDDPNHSFVGNGIVNHNTLQLLSALCYQWEKEPDNKAIVVTPKSALRQWAGEVEKFTVGIDTYVVSGKPEERKAMYEKWAAAPTGPNARKAILLVNYAILVRDWDVGGERPLLPNGQPDPKKPVSPGLLDRITANISRLVVTYDECFDYHTPILLADGSTELIGRIVSKRLPVSVLSMNWKTGSIEEKRVVNWFRKPLTHSRRESLLKIGFRFAGVVNVTPSHVFYNTRGESFRANTLKPGKKTAMFVEDIPSDDQLQVILGSLLGDASLSHPQRVCWGICMGHSIKQASYLEFKRDLLKPLGVSDISFYQTELQSGEQRMCRFRLNGNIALTSRLASWGVHDGVKRKLSVSLLDQIGPLGLAIWYSDDGSLDTKTLTDGTVRRTITLHTEGFSHEENELLAGWLRWRWDVEARVLRTKSRKEGHYSVIYLPAEAAERFLALLPGALPGVEYKWPAGTPVLGVKSFKTEPLRGIVEDQVVSVEPWLPRSTNKRFVYDIEVDGNHNYFANGTLVSNCTAFKNTGTKTWQVCRQLSDRAKRCYGLTATLLKNNLMEGFSIYKVIQPTIFATKTKFMDEFCVVKLQPVGGGRKVPVVVGYRNLDHFRRIIDPFFLGRQKHMVSSELPKLITRQIVCEMSPSEDTKYAEALSGVLELGDGETKEYQETAALTSLIYCQQVVDSLHLLRFEEGQEIAVGLFKDESVKVKDKGAKEEALVDLITGELDDEKVIVYTRFEKLVGRLQSVLTAAGVKSVRITGKENDVKRREAQQAFQDLKSDTKIIFITDAGSEAINLQAASAIVFYDAPWSWGTYVQLLGRPIRIGSIHDTVVAYHIVAKRPKGKYKSDKTIDDHVLQLLGSKKNLVDKVLGEAAVGALSFNKDEAGGNATRELLRMMKENK